MENENSNKKMNGKFMRKRASNKDKRSSVLKQLDNKKLYPIQERVGMYLITVLSTIGLVLIGYTGIMVLASNTTETIDEPIVDAAEVHEMLDDIDLESPFEDDEPEQGVFEPAHEYVEPDDDVVEQEPDAQPESTPEPEEDAPDAGAVSTPTTAVVNSDLVGLRRAAGDGSSILNLHTGDTVDIIDFDSNPFWVFVAYSSSDFGRIEGYIAREFLDVDQWVLIHLYRVDAMTKGGICF